MFLMKKPYIGVIALVDEKKESYWMLPGYLKALEEAGAIPLVLPLTEDEEILNQIINDIDGLLLTGGHDISPSIYNEEVYENAGVACVERDTSEILLIRKAIEKNMPLLGICRGIQLLNAVLGGTLYQDLPSQYNSEISHQMTKPYDRAVHNVTILPETLLSEIIPSGEIGVNSYHHQAIKDLASSLKVAAISEDKLVEAVYIPTQKFALAVQWHPEFSYKVDAHSMNIFKAFAQACV